MGSRIFTLWSGLREVCGNTITYICIQSHTHLLAQQALHGAIFTSVSQFREAVDAFITAYNSRAVPFEWTKREAIPVEPKQKYAYLGK